MVNIKVKDSNAQKIVLQILCPSTVVDLRIEGTLIVKNINEELTVELFKMLLENNMVSKVDFSYVKEEKDQPKEKEPKKVLRNQSSLTEDIYNYLAQNKGKEISIKEISEKLKSSYSSVNSAIRRLCEQGKLERSINRKYFYPIEQPKHKESEIVQTAGAEDNDIVDENAEQNADTEEEKEILTLTIEEKKKVMKELFADASNGEVLKYFFPNKSKVIVTIAQKKFIGPRAEVLSNVISKLYSSGIIIFNDDFNEGGSYTISAIWRIWAYLNFAGKSVSGDTIKVDIGMKTVDFNAAIKDALNSGLIKQTVDEKKKNTTYAII